MKVFYKKGNYFYILEEATKKLITVYESNQQITNYMEKHDLVFLPEDYFFYKSDYIHFYTNTPFSIKEQKKLVQEKLNQFVKQNKEVWKLLQWEMIDIKIDWQPTKYIFGKTGQISFQLNLLCVDNIQDIDFERLIEHHITVLPQSRHTVKYCMELFDYRDFGILYIWNHTSKLIKIKSWYYEDLQILNIGKDELRSMYANYDLTKYLYNNDIKTKVSTDILHEVNMFFSEKLISWLSEYVEYGTNIMVVSELSSNDIFMENLKKTYSKYINWYVLPINFEHFPQIQPNIASYLTIKNKLLQKKQLLPSTLEEQQHIEQQKEEQTIQDHIKEWDTLLRM